MAGGRQQSLMLPPDLLGPLPPNLSRQAARDLIQLLRVSFQQWGLVTARRTRDRILARCWAVAEGRAVGHRRPDIPTTTAVLFVNEPPFVIAYHAETGRVLRILHGARDFPALFGQDRPLTPPG